MSKPSAPSPANPPKPTEAEFQRQVTDLATVYGWLWAHAYPARTTSGWHTPVQGTMSAGWPDLQFLRIRDKRFFVAELKRDAKAKRATPRDQLLNLRTWQLGGVPAYLWEPSEWGEIEAVLRGTGTFSKGLDTFLDVA